jgi:prepilin signal peptidase PulO-like enzyme (type II secretory pathway)
MPTVFLAALVALYGIIFGSFANVLVLRDDRRESILTGRSECPQCKRGLSWYELVPVFSFLAQAGRCRGCHTRISWQYPLVELLSGALWLFAFWFGFLEHGSWVVTGLLGISLYLFMVISLIDLRTMSVSLEYCVLAGLFGAAGMVLGHVLDVQEVLYGALVGGGSIAVVLYGWKLAFKQDGMGVGDIWIATVLGAVAGFPLIVATLLAAVFGGSLVGLGYMAVSRQGLKTAIPFGPFLVVGMVIALVWGREVIGWYILQLS